MKRRSVLSISVIVLFLFLPFISTSLTLPLTTAQGEELPPWEHTNGPYGGLINSIEMDPTNPNVLYAAGAGDSIFKSVNGGDTWNAVGYLPKSIPKVVDLIISPTNPQILYTLTAGSRDWGTVGEVYISTNGGENWTLTTQDMSVFHIALHPTNPMVLLAVAWGNFVYLTTNGGVSWTNVTGNLPFGSKIGVAISGDNDYWVGVDGADNGSLYHTTDGGGTWNFQNLNQPAETFINNIMVHPSNSSIVFVSVTTAPDAPVDPDTDYIFRTGNGGASWQSINTLGTMRILAVEPSTGGDTIYGSLTGIYIFRTHNLGQTWINMTPPPSTSDINDIAIDYTDNNTIYIPKRTYGIYKSVDGGTSWTTLTNGIYNTNACLVVASPVEASETVYVAAVEGTGTFRTDDAGNSWSWLDGGGITHPFADELRFNPHNPDTIWQIADIGQIFISYDRGATWIKKYHPQHGYGFRYSSVQTIKAAPSDPDILYAVKSGWGPFRSGDGGRTWDFLAESEVDYSYTLAVHPTDPSTVYSGYNPKPFQDWAMVRKSTDGGLTWQTVLNVTASDGITSIAIDPADPNIVYAGSISETGGEIYKTFDAGLNWEKLNDNFTMSTVMAQPQLVVDPTNPGVAYIGTWLGGTWRTNDAGMTWTLLETAPDSATAIKIDPQNNNVLYLADRSSPTLWKSLDAGETWFDIADFTSEGAFLVNNVYADGDVLYCTTFGPPPTGGKLFKSIDAGANWTDITGILPRSVLDIDVDPISPEIVYVTTHVKGAYKSINGGTTWSELVNFPDIGGFDIEVDPADSNILYVAALGNTSIPSWVDPRNFTFADSSGVYKSFDAGLTWSSVLNTTNKCRAIRMHPGNSSILFAAVHDDGVFVSQDAGTNWVNYNTGLDTTGLTSLDVQGDTIYVGTQGYGVYSGNINPSDYSITWQSSRSNRPVPQVYSMQIIIDPHNSNRIYVGAYPGGLYRSDDGGATFYDKNFQTPSIIAEDPFRQGYYSFDLLFSNSSEVWLGTWGGGMFKSYDAMDHNVHADGIGNTMLGKHVYQIKVNPSPPFTVYAATEEGVFLTEDSGATWINFSMGLDSLQVRSFEITSSGKLLCGTLGYGIYEYNSTLNQWVQQPPFSNLGNVWPIWSDRPSYQYSTLLFHPVNPDIIYIGVFPAGIFMSTDGGNSWVESNTGWTNDGVFALETHPQDPDIIYAGTYNGISRSLDGGHTWEMWDDGFPAEQWTFSIAFDNRDPSVMYACSKNGENEGNGRKDFGGTVMKSINGGEHWYEITDGLNITQEFYKIIVDKFNPDVLYLATEFEGVFISYNGGDLWEPWTDGLTNLRAGSSGNNIANPLALSADGRYLYFGTFGTGVFRRATLGPPVTTTTLPTGTQPTSTISSTTPTTGPGIPLPIEILAITAGAALVAIIAILVIIRKKGKS
ncbi:MAG: hypothetical protein ACFFE7_13205 [Candidatus Thorarchaeota archaeon]